MDVVDDINTKETVEAVEAVNPRRNSDCTNKNRPETTEDHKDHGFTHRQLECLKIILRKSRPVYQPDYCFIYLLTLTVGSAMLGLSFLTLFGSYLQTRHAISVKTANDIASMRSEIVTLHERTTQLEDVVEILAQNQAVEHPVPENTNDGLTEIDELSPYRYTIQEVRTLQQLHLIDRNGNECTAPLHKHETVCREIYNRK